MIRNFYEERVRQKRGICYKLSDDSEITAAICAVINGENVYPDEIPVVKIGNAWSTEIDWQHMNVLRELSAGKMDEEIAKTLHLSVYTVKKYISHLKDMTGYRNQHRAGSWQASRLGLVTPGY